MIPKNPPPQLDASFSKPFREFVSLCLQRDPSLRPSAKDLLRHRFIKNAKRTSTLIELIDRLSAWRSETGSRADHWESDAGDEDSDEGQGDLWDFGSIKSMKGRHALAHETVKMGTPNLRASTKNQETFSTPLSTPQRDTASKSSDILGTTRREHSLQDSESSLRGGTVRAPAHAHYRASNAPEQSHAPVLQETRRNFDTVVTGESFDRLQVAEKPTLTSEERENSKDSRPVESVTSFIGRPDTYASHQAKAEVPSLSETVPSQGDSESVLRKGSKINDQAQRRPSDDLTALDTVFSPVLEQLSLAVSRHHASLTQSNSVVADDAETAAQRSIRRLHAALVDCESSTKGFANAFAIEVFHAMSGEGEEHDSSKPLDAPE